jgi:hypothetical protein
MTTIEYACKRMQAFLGEVSELLNSEFPYPHSKEALEIVYRKFSEKLEYLENRNPHLLPEQVHKDCSKALKSLCLCLPIIGFILRSTNVRNSFEVYRPLLRLACSILEPEIGRIGSKGIITIFSLSDILDLQSIAKRLQEPSDKDVVSKFLRLQLSDTTINLLSTYNAGPNPLLHKALVNDLNRISERIYLGEQIDTSRIELTSETKIILHKNVKPKIFLNRLILQDTYKSEIEKWPRTRLLLSSEWRYSPYTIPEPPELNNFVLIGLPAPESTNPLLVPVAGHELGHSLWARSGYSTYIRPLLQERIIEIIESKWHEYKRAFPQVSFQITELSTDILAPETFANAREWGLKQIEETFCDFVGVRIFGRAYLYAFAYLLSPNHSTPRSLNYPNMKVRASNISYCADYYKLQPWPDYEALFMNMPEPILTAGDEFQLKLACDGLQRCVPDLLKEIDNMLTQAGICMPKDLTDSEDARRIYACFERVIPAEAASSLSSILIAGWHAFENKELWKKMPHVQEKRDSVLKELILKTIEIYEYNQITMESV